MSLTVEPTPPEASAEWDAFVRSRGGWTPYHLHGWRRVLGGALGLECIYLAARDPAGGIRGVLPLVRVKSVVFGHYLVSMPFLNYGGPLGDEEAVRALTREAVRVADESGVELLELRCASSAPIDLVPSHRKITVLLDLPAGDPEALWQGLKAKLRSQVKRPMKEGVEVTFGPGELDGFYRVFARHMRDLGTPAQSKQLFEAARDALGDAMWFGCAYLDGAPVAAGSGFRWADRFELVWASSLREHNRIAPNMLLYWRFLERCCADGAKVFDFGRCTPGGGTHRFKLQWGGRDEPLWWYQHGPKAGGGTPSPDSGPFSLAPRIWSRLPLALTNALGPRVVKYIP
ncbi:MAG TPA: FemAB family XrtA/PEP-CTERM system-associated protein [Longimicrobiales bacterium]|nr:FemAB family XrtA/PEP-CTERM system-associated protein [Longimicrobiales bacterium]